VSLASQHPSRSAHLNPKRLVLVDDHGLIREGLRQVLQAQPGLVIVGESDTGHGALSILERARAHVAIVDLNLPGLSGMNLISRIRSDHPDCAVLVLSMYAEELYAMRALKAGAQGYLTKDTAADELVRAVHKVAAGGCYLSRGMAERVAMALAHHDTTPRHERLTDRELEVFRCILAGQRISEISRNLHLSVKTISTHKTRILQKMQLDSTAALIRYGLEHQLFPDPALQVDPHHAAAPARMPARASAAQGVFSF
jgi:DNA-binding NarL/FixJ family response regulator